MRAGVSAIGFGGVNTHVALEAAPGHASGPDARTHALVAGRQDAELLLLAAPTHDALRARLRDLADLLPRLSYAELTDLAADLARDRPDAAVGGVRCAIVAADPHGAARAARTLGERLDAGETEVLAPAEGVFVAARAVPPRLTLLLPGQGTGSGVHGALSRRFPRADPGPYGGRPTESADHVATETAQPRIVAGSLAALAVLHDLGVTARAAVGHSLGELTALHWAGALSAEDALDLAVARGRAMADHGSPDGAMAGLSAGPDRVERLLAAQDPDPGSSVVVAGHNGPEQTVVSGRADAVDRLLARARSEGIAGTRLRVSHAFHSPLVAGAAGALDRVLADLPLRPLTGRVVSTVTGATSPRTHPCATCCGTRWCAPSSSTRPSPACARHRPLRRGRARTGSVRPGPRLAPDTPALPLDTDAPTLGPLLRALGAAFALGAPVDAGRLFHGRLARPLPETLTFLSSPCETAPDLALDRTATPQASPADAPTATADDTVGAADTLSALRALVAARVELPVETVTAHTRPLDELHLSSITVGQIVNEVTRARGLPPLEAVSGHATSSLADLAATIDGLAASADSVPERTAEPAGVGPWVRAFRVDHAPSPAPAPTAVRPGTGTGPAEWSVHAHGRQPLAVALGEALAGAGIGGGVLLVPTGEDPDVPLNAVREAARRGVRCVLVQDRPLASGLARTLHLERPEVPVTVVEVADTAPADPDAARRLVDRVVAEAAATTAYTEVRHGPDGERDVPVLTPLTPADPPPDTEPPLGPDDVLLVTGGGKASPPSARWTWPARTAPPSSSWAARTPVPTPSWPPTSNG
ncbi:acyltransferase domain-containing protein [Nocardiopsis sp. CNR-923]|uniref:acyltransferase domain-containing protein n=1 Tax=Nocardiopsis sp. CNR-923 TaxID=1904965 RepID=UPI0021CC6BBE|nr:acyltransferase domain-containing protein [Nocardiopsis sp. CNR-923]